MNYASTNNKQGSFLINEQTSVYNICVTSIHKHF